MERISNFPLENVYFLDETGFDVDGCMRDHGWGAGRLEVAKNFNRLRKRKNMVATIGLNGFFVFQFVGIYLVHSYFSILSISPKILERTNNEISVDHIQQLAQALPPNSLLIMDNLRVHTSEVTIESMFEFFQPKNCAIGLLPTHSPDLNPIEILFGLIKRILPFFF